VIDASVAIKWVVEEEDSEAAAGYLGGAIHAPELLLVECANALTRRIRRGEATLVQARGAFNDLASLPFAFRPDRTLAGHALTLAMQLGHAVYDCLYLALALDLDGFVITADRRFKAAADRVGIDPPRVRLLGATA